MRLLRWTFLTLLCLSGAIAASADEYDDLRLRWRDMLTGGTNLNLGDPLVQSRLVSIANTANSYWSTLNTNAARTYLWADAARTDQSEDITTSYSRLRAMALAWATRGCSLASNAPLGADILSGLDWLYTNRYNEAKAEYDNWWDWEIGSPQHLNNTAILLYDRLSPARLTNCLKAVDKFVPVTTYTGANRTDTALVVAIRGILGRDAAKLANARDGLSPVFPYVTTGDGFYTDGSFLQHGKHPYTGSYGSVLMDGISRLLWLLNGSAWQVTDPAQRNVFRWVYDAYEPVIYRGATLDNLRGRAISRQVSTDHSTGAGNMSSILQLAQFAPTNDAIAFKRMLKYWIQADTFRSFTNNVALNLMEPTRALMADTNLAPRGELIGHFQFPSMDRVVHLRPGFGFALSMSSSRIYTYECINSENLHGWFTGDGMTTLYNDDLGQFSGNFWATVDPYHLPGTTVDQTNRLNGSGQSATTGQNWVGGASLATNFGVAGMALDAQNSSLVARKSWFLFDHEIVCLGAGITCGGTNAVHTTVENRRLSSAATNVFTAGGSTMATTLGWNSNFAALTWCSLAGAGGYYFPGGAALSARREARTNTWYEINSLSQPTASLTNPVSDNFLTLWFNHGAKPTNATYAYALLPNFTSSQVAAYAASPDFVVLLNSTNSQAVRETTLGITAANFWNSGTNSADFITVNHKASVLVRETGTNLEVALSDPSQTNTGNIILTLNRSAHWTVATDAGVTVQQLSPQIRLAFAVNGLRGRSLRATFSADPSNPNPTWDANPGASGAQDGAGTWDAASLNWWNSVTNVAWNDDAWPIATFGSGGMAGTVMLPAARSVGSLIFAPVSSGQYTFAGSGPLTLRTGITASNSANFNVPLVLSEDQLWSVPTGKVLSFSEPLSVSQPLAISLAGAGTVNLNGSAQLPDDLAVLVFTDDLTLGLNSPSHRTAGLALADDVSATLRGTGSLTISGAIDLEVGGSSSGAGQSLDLAGLNHFSYYAPNQTFAVGGQTSSIHGSGELWLATNSTVTARTMGVQIVTGSTSAQSSGALYLGHQTTINADFGQVGLTRDNGAIQFAPGTASPALVIRGSDGVSPAKTWTIGSRSSSYHATNTALLDLVTGLAGVSSLDARIGTMEVANETYCLTTSRVLNGTVRMGGGMLDATNIVLGRKSSISTQSLAVVNATFVQTNGGTVAVNTLTLGNITPGNTGALSATYQLGGGGTLKAGLIQPGSGAANRTFHWADGTLRNRDAATDLTMAGGFALTLAAGVSHIFDLDAGRTGTIHTALVGSGSLIKAGVGAVILTASNNFSGKTVVNGGTLALAGDGSLNSSPLLSLAGGALFNVEAVSGGYALGAAQTLSGDGSVRGNVRINGFLSPGASLGTLSFGSNLVLAGTTIMELARTSGFATNDQIVALGTVTCGGSLVVTNIGTNALLAGDTFKLFTAAAQVGTFASLTLPPLTPPLVWTNRLAEDGTLAIVAPINPTPANLIFSVNGDTLRLSWPADRTGWRLEVQTNHLSVGVSSNWSTWPGSATTNAVFLPVNLANPALFLRLAYP